jgi:hypothetical protein
MGNKKMFTRKDFELFNKKQLLRLCELETKNRRAKGRGYPVISKSWKKDYLIDFALIYLTGVTPVFWECINGRWRNVKPRYPVYSQELLDKAARGEILLD